MMVITNFAKIHFDIEESLGRLDILSGFFRAQGVKGGEGGESMGSVEVGGSFPRSIEKLPNGFGLMTDCVLRRKMGCQCQCLYVRTPVCMYV
jgi:hypothetical protein